MQIFFWQLLKVMDGWWLVRNGLMPLQLLNINQGPGPASGKELLAIHAIDTLQCKAKSFQRHFWNKTCNECKSHWQTNSLSLVSKSQDSSDPVCEVTAVQNWEKNVAGLWWLIAAPCCWCNLSWWRICWSSSAAVPKSASFIGGTLEMCHVYCPKTCMPCLSLVCPSKDSSKVKSQDWQGSCTIHHEIGNWQCSARWSSCEFQPSYQTHMSLAKILWTFTGIFDHPVSWPRNSKG